MSIAEPQAVFDRKIRKLLKAGAIIIAVIMVMEAMLSYYFQPVLGEGSTSSYEIYRGQSVVFMFVPTQGIPPYSYNWSFGDGGFSSEQNPTHYYVVSGDYKPTVIITDSAGVQASWTTFVTVKNPTVYVDEVIAYDASSKTNSTLTKFTVWMNGAIVVYRGGVFRIQNYYFDLVPKTSPTIRIQLESQGTITSDQYEVITVPATTVDLYCALWFQVEPWSGQPMQSTSFTLLPHNPVWGSSLY